ncbi:MAG TPA: carbohydrate kinase [Candidatus Acidoferrum sp.]|nr:carbohydrate kinase [Candidatus Acidoferrum sp.]
MKKFTTVGLGELLWDVFPESRQLGGAPANFAYITNLLGDDGIVASRVGSDELGEEAKARLQSLGLDTSHIQTDATYGTGVARIQVDAKGQPTFAIAAPVAWDFFEWTAAWESLAWKADVVCFGSLAQRLPQSRQTTASFLKALRPQTTRVFDANLRQPFYSAEILKESAQHANIMKLNHEELPTVVSLLGGPRQEEAGAARWLRSAFGLELVCVTRGDKGSLLVGEKGVDEHTGIAVRVRDTVGAGDAFTAALVHHFLRRHSLSSMNEAANRMGAWVASHTGATPPRDESQLASVRCERD